MIPSPASKRARTAAALDYLAGCFPAAFAADPAAVQPLELGIRAALVEHVARDAAADALAVLWALRRWCLARAYVEAVAAGRARIGLDGQPVGAPAVEHQAQARARLDAEGAATAARAKRREQAERAKAKGKDGARAGQGSAGKPAIRAPAPAAPGSGAPTRSTARPGQPAPDSPAPGARGASVVTKNRPGRLANPAASDPPASPAATGAPTARPVLGLGKRPKPAG